MSIDFIEIPKRVLRNQKRFSFRSFHFFINKNNSCRRIKGFVVIFRVVYKNNFPILNHVNFVGSQNRKIFVANHFGSDEFCNRF